MGKNPLVSIIVPVYNVETWLPKCLKSLRQQTWQEMEVWLVNDGSTDNSLEVCRAVEAEDARFHVIDQENAGVSAARNAGMDQATGKYLQFVDADDWLPENSTETLVHAAESAGVDLVVACFYRENNWGVASHGHIREQRLMTRQEYAEQMLEAPANFYFGVLWNKLYRRHIVEAHHLRCEEDLSWCEDFLFNLEYLKFARLIQAVPTPVYYYVKRDDSLLNGNISLRRTAEMKKTTFAVYRELYKQLDLYEEQKAGVYRYLISSAMDGVVLPLPDFMEELRDRTEEERRQKREKTQAERKRKQGKAELEQQLKQEQTEMKRRLREKQTELDLQEKREKREAHRQERHDQAVLQRWQRQDRRMLDQQDRQARRALREEPQEQNGTKG